MARQVSTTLLANVVRTALRSSAKPASLDAFCGLAAVSGIRAFPSVASSCGTITRGFTSSGLRSDVAGKKLTAVFAEELSAEKDTFEPSPEVKEGPPAPFKYVEKEESCELTLTRDFENEKITISFIANDNSNEFEEPPEENEEEEYPAPSVYFSVDVNKGTDVTVSFQCSTDGEDFEVREIFYEDKANLADDPYNGPEWNMMDEKVQDGTYKYLQARGINEDLCIFITEAAKDKEQREYMRWLERMQEFLEKP